MSATEAPPARPGRRRGPQAVRPAGRLVPYWLLLPGILWLLVFFALPMVYQASTSVQTGSLEKGFEVTWHFPTYWDALADYYPQFLRSLLYAGDRDAAVPAARLPARLSDRVPGGPLAQPGAGAGRSRRSSPAS